MSSKTTKCEVDIWLFSQIDQLENWNDRPAMGVEIGFASGVWLRHLFKADPLSQVTGVKKIGRKNVYITKKNVNGDGLLTLRPFSKCTWHNASSCMMCLFFQEGSSKLAGSPNLMVGKPSTPTSSPNSTNQSPDMSQIFPESTLRTPTHGFSITNAVLQMLYGGKHLWHVATCFDKKPQLVTLHMSHMSSFASFISQPALHIAHEDGGMTVVLLHQLIPCRFHGLKRLVPWCWYVSSKRNCEKKVEFKLTPCNSCHVSMPKKGVPKLKFLQNMFGTKKLRGLSTF